VAASYFRAGADKVSIGSDAVYAAEAWYARGRKGDGSSSIEEIAAVYGAQAVVVSLDPRRVWLENDAQVTEAVAAGHTVVQCADSSLLNVETASADDAGPSAVPSASTKRATSRACWYQCTVRGGREGRPLDARALAVAAAALGAGELLVNSVDADGRKDGFDEVLLRMLCDAVRVPIIASSGAGTPAHFVSVFQNTRVEAALAAGIFHRREVSIDAAKAAVQAAGIPVRRLEPSHRE